MVTFLNTYDGKEAAIAAAHARADEHRRTFHVLRDYGRFLAVPSRSDPGYSCMGAWVCSVEPGSSYAN